MEEKTITFWEWLNQQDIHLARWQPTEEYDLWGNDRHEHVLVPLEEEETEVILERYLRNVRKVYGEPRAAGESI
jgi:hypothetical protein